MTDIPSRLRDSLLQHDGTAGADFATDARALRQWIDSLPLANIAAAETELLAALRSIDRQDLAPATRHRVLEALRDPVAQVTGLIRKVILGASLPLPEVAAAHGLAALQSQDLLAAGYRRVLVQLMAPSGKARLFKRKLAVGAATRAMQHGAAALRMAYTLYRAPGAGSWQAMHDVRGWLAMYNLQGRDVADPLLGKAVQADAIYLQALLLALANPYRFTQRERLDVVACLDAIGAHAGLTGPHTDDGDERAASVVRVALLGDVEPGHVARMDVDDEDGSGHPSGPWLALDMAPLMAFVEEVIGSMPPDAAIVTFRQRGAPAVHAEPKLVRRLLSGWGERTGRFDERHPGGYHVATAIGLHDMHYELAGETSFARFIDGIEQRQVALSGATPANAWVQSPVPRISRMSASVLDQSLAGYRLGWMHGDGSATVRAKVGDPIAIGVPVGGDDIDWMIGTIRWLRSRDDMMEGGIRLLARRALPVGMRTAAQVARGQELQRAFLLLEMGDPQLGYTGLLTPPITHEPDGFQVELALPPDATHWRMDPQVERISVPAAQMEEASTYSLVPIPPGVGAGAAMARITA